MKTKNTVFLAIIAFCIASIGVSDELIDLDTKTLLQEIDANLDVIEADKPAVASDNRSSVVGLQNELNRLGCNAGPVDGILGSRTRTAFATFIKSAGATFNESEMLSKEFYEYIKNSRDKCVQKANKKVLDVNLVGKYDLRVTCNNTTRKHWLVISKLDEIAPNGAAYSFRVNQRFRGYYDLCGGPFCLWAFAGHIFHTDDPRSMSFKVNAYATKYYSGPADFNGIYVRSKDGKSISGLDKKACKVLAQR